MGNVVIKGQKADLTKVNPGIMGLTVGIGWESPAAVEVDTSAFLLGTNGKVAKDEDLIFYNNPLTPFIEYKGIETGTDKKQFKLSLPRIPNHIEKIAFSLTIYDSETRKQSFGQVQNAFIRFINDATGQEILRYDLGNSFSVETAIVVGELYKYNGEWKFNAVGAGFAGGLQALCGNFGIEVSNEPVQSEVAATTEAPPRPQPTPIPAPTPPPAPAAAPINLNLTKIELKKKGDSINLKKSAGGLGEILINLNWNQKQSKPGGFFSRGSKTVDLDLACLYELKDGQKGVIQALGESFGSLTRAPYISLDGDDRTGSVKSGENLRINGSKVAEIERILVFTFIYEGVTNWAEADGIVTLKQAGGPDIVVDMNEHDNRKRMCAIAMIRNVNNETFSVERLVQFYSGHKEIDQAYGFGMRWVAGSK
ncbi:tellurium resistance protein TerA [Paenibacillus baekrokdamisoli]|uniref:Tellurium resistance protein TerA n=1 Tax=Paenibacillus baekrokdamisoli TaxID=1712516 RepID=A0A3G9IVP7_9BACL|nr:TerD family protein [Paenibacillus baekrokdamisoli]MBB3068055.1 tellurite resistance protein TerA [Paenibacillus baekrokdamisoli]BBH22900.1 tellurium resistance protein TerA [Paenibacillus baekrokdamisoli]